MTLSNFAHTLSGLSQEKSPETLQFLGFLFGAPGRGRIHNLLIRSQTLYPVELRAQVAVFGSRVILLAGQAFVKLGFFILLLISDNVMV